MKQKKIVSIIGALVLLISAVAVITGCSQVNDVKSVDKSAGIIEFDSATIKCQNTNSSPYTDVASGSQIQIGDRLLCEAILPAGKIVENWYVNDVKQESETSLTMIYAVKASDVSGGKLKIGVVFKEAEKGTVEFDPAAIKCQNTNSYPFTDVTSGSPIQEKDKLLFEAILPTGKIVENWYINDVKQEYKTDSTMIYTVKASDVSGGKLKISVVFKEAEKGTVEFDSAVIKCKNTNSYPYTDVASGSPIQEKDKLLFEAILPTGKIVENWYINDVKQEYKTDSTMIYTVKASDIVGGKIKIGVVFK